MTVKRFKRIKKYLTPYMKHMGRTPEEQLQKNQAAMRVLRAWLDEKVSEEESKQREIYFNSFKENIDSQRPPGYKLYSEE